MLGSPASKPSSVLSMSLSQSLSTESQTSMPPLLGVHWYSQPSLGSPLASTQPASQSFWLVVGSTAIWHVVAPATSQSAGSVAVVTQSGVACGSTQSFPHSPQLSRSSQTS